MATPIFTDVDKDGSGGLSSKELYEHINTFDQSVTHNAVQDLVTYWDTDEDGEVSADEFEKGIAVEEEDVDPEAEAKHVLKLCDTDEDGKISLQEAKDAQATIGVEWSEEDTANFNKMDTDGDGEASLEELEAQIKAEWGGGEGGEPDDEPEDARPLSEDLAGEVWTEHAEHSKPESRLLQSLQRKDLRSKISGEFARQLGHPSRPALGSNLTASSAMGLLVVPLLVVAFGCRRRFRSSSPELGETGAALVETVEE